jgi:hypothetical protein
VSSNNTVDISFAERVALLDITLHQVRLMMAEEEKTRAEAGTGIIHDVSAAAFLLLGMDILGLQ